METLASEGNQEIIFKVLKTKRDITNESD